MSGIMGFEAAWEKIIVSRFSETVNCLALLRVEYLASISSPDPRQIMPVWVCLLVCS